MHACIEVFTRVFEVSAAVAARGRILFSLAAKKAQTTCTILGDPRIS
jgi:hypothetical protein